MCLAPPCRPLEAREGAQMQARQWEPWRGLRGSNVANSRCLGVALKGRGQPFPHPKLGRGQPSCQGAGLPLARALGSLREHSSSSPEFMARGASSAMACAVYEPLSGLEIDCLS